MPYCNLPSPRAVHEFMPELAKSSQLRFLLFQGPCGEARYDFALDRHEEDQDWQDEQG